MFEQIDTLKIVIFMVMISLVISYFQIKGMKKLNRYNSILKDKLDFKLSDLEIMDDREFEYWCAKLFKYKGYKAIVTQATNDEGKDLVLNKAHNSIYVECKHWQEDNNIGREILQKLVGACVADNINKCIVITTSYFNKKAIEYRNKLNKNTNIELKLYDINDIKDVLKEISKEEIKEESHKKIIKSI